MFAVLYFINFDVIKTYLKALMMIVGLVLCVAGVASGAAMIPATIITAVVLFLAKLAAGAVVIFFFSLLTKPR